MQNGHFAISVMIVGVHVQRTSDENNKPGIILSSNVVYVGSPVVIMLQKIQGNIRDQRNKK